MSAPKLTWQWDHERERYAGPGEHDYVEAVPSPVPECAVLWAGNTEEPETCLDAEVVVPVSAVLAALIRAFGRETVVAWAQHAQLEPGDQVELFVAAGEVCNDCGDFCATCGAGDDRSSDEVEP